MTFLFLFLSVKVVVFGNHQRQTRLRSLTPCLMAAVFAGVVVASGGAIITMIGS